MKSVIPLVGLNIAISACFALPSVLAANPSGLQAGAAAIDITPRRLPIVMSGSFGNRQAVGVHDPLHARALVLDDGATCIALVACDSLLLSRDIFDAAKAEASKITGIPAGHILMAATHTHSGPAAVPLAKIQPNPQYRAYLQQQLAAAVVLAKSRLRPAKIGWGVGQLAEQVHNRRWHVKKEAISPNPFGRVDERVRTNPPPGSDVLLHPAGPTDPDVACISVRTSDNRPLALLGSYALHYVGGVPAGQLSADYFGEFASQIAQRVEGDDAFVGMLFNGASGDINNINFVDPQRRSPPGEQIRRVSSNVADVALQAIEGVAYRDDMQISVETRNLSLGVRRPNDEELTRARAMLAAAADPDMLTRDEVYAYEAMQLACWPAREEAPLQVIRIGELGIVALPCEAFAEIGLEIKRRSPYKPTVVIGLANGYNGYLPTPEQHALGGYETWRCRWSYLEPAASEKIVDTVEAMCREMFSGKSSD
ncbi:MAG: neutral/alkaline non-lysosomal ceramidase N-terminal domain-containing protein [Planctomycetales bacterium]|nr:neutral/alkaline non-lysosomal ceramidase N-terminal domain-containing protein [Planctomycetales bacterium]